MLLFQGAKGVLSALGGVDIEHQEAGGGAGRDAPVCRLPRAPPGLDYFWVRGRGGRPVAEQGNLSGHGVDVPATLSIGEGVLEASV